MSIKEDFEKAFERKFAIKFGLYSRDSVTPVINSEKSEMALWAAKWAFERAEKEVTRVIVKPTGLRSDWYGTLYGDIKEALRSLVKELE